MELSNEATKYARWLRDNPHHYSSWEPQDKFPDCTHMVVSGDTGRIEIPANVQAELIGKMRFDKDGHMFYPSDELMEAIK